MTPQQHNAEAVRAHELRMQALGNAYDRTQGAMADIHRRVVSEPWYGRDVFDHTYDRQMGYLQGQSAAQEGGTIHGTAQASAKEQGTGTIHGPAQEPSKDQATIHGPGPGQAPTQGQPAQDDVMQRFYGNGQEPGQDKGRGQGIEP